MFAFGWTLLELKSIKSCLGFWGFPGISEMCPTLRSCISELSEYFFKISKDLERSMSKLYNEPNTSEKWHLAQKLRAIQDRWFSKISIHIPTDGIGSKLKLCFSTFLFCKWFWLFLQLNSLFSWKRIRLCSEKHNFQRNWSKSVTGPLVKNLKT